MSEAPDNPTSSDDLMKVFDPFLGWVTRYSPSLKEHIYALGVAAANFNHLEFALLALFYNFLGLDDVAARYLFSYLTNARRIDILLRAVEARESDADIRERVSWFAQCFNICAENRNFLMHGMTENTWNALTIPFAVADTLTLRKAPRNDPTKTNYLHLTVEQIRKIADEMYQTDMFGLKLYVYADAKKRGGASITSLGEKPTLPEKPPLPSSLTLSDSPTPQGVPPQPESSQE